MPAKFDRCVKQVMSQGKSKDSAYAICVAMWKKKYGKSPFASEELDFSSLDEFEQFAKTMNLAAVEMEMFEQVPEVFIDLQKNMEEVQAEIDRKEREKTLKSLQKNQQ